MYEYNLIGQFSNSGAQQSEYQRLNLLILCVPKQHSMRILIGRPIDAKTAV